MNMHKLVGVNLVTVDPVRLAGFYRDVLGAELEESHGGPDRIEIWFGPKGEDTACIVANRDPGFVPRAYGACQGFELRVEDVDTLYARVCAAGIQPENPPGDLPWGYRYFHIKDPDGNGIDLVQKL